MAASEQLQFGFAEEWRVDEQPLSSVADVICGQHLLPHEQAETGIPYITGPADFSDRTAQPSRFSSVRKAICLPGDVLLTVKGSGLGKVNLAPSSPAVIGRQLFALRPHARVLDQVFLWRVLQHTLTDIKGTTSSTTVPGIGRDIVQALRIPLPPLSEQRRIVARIEELGARIERARGLRREASAVVSMIMPKALETMRAGLLSSEYPKGRIGQFTHVTSGGTPSRKEPAYWGGSIPWVKTGELLDGDISETEEHITQQGVDNSSAKLFPPETVLIALYGQGQTRGRTGRLMIEATTNQACCYSPSSFTSRIAVFAVLATQLVWRDTPAIARRHSTQSKRRNDQGH